MHATRSTASVKASKVLNASERTDGDRVVVPDVRVLRNQKLETLHAAVFVVAVGGVRGGLASPGRLGK